MYAIIRIFNHAKAPAVKVLSTSQNRESAGKYARREAKAMFRADLDYDIVVDIALYCDSIYTIGGGYEQYVFGVIDTFFCNIERASRIAIFV